jgi:hypothetical protein
MWTALQLAIEAFCIGEFDGQPVRLDLNPGDMDEDGVRDLGGVVEVTPNRFCDEGLDLVCRNPADGSGLFGACARPAFGIRSGVGNELKNRACGYFGTGQILQVS